MNHFHNPVAHTLPRFGVPLAMLDFVARPHPPTSCFAIGSQRRAKALAISIALFCALLPGVSGCRVAASNTEPSRAKVRQARQAQQSKMDQARQELEQIPPPSKNRYLNVHTQEAYGNPFIVVHPQTVTLTSSFVTRIRMPSLPEVCCVRQKRANKRSTCGWRFAPGPRLPFAGCLALRPGSGD